MALFNPKAGQVQCDEQGRPGHADIFRCAHRAAVHGAAGVQLLGLLMVIPRFDSVPGLRWLWDGTHPGTIINQRGLDGLQHRYSGRGIAVARESRQSGSMCASTSRLRCGQDWPTAGCRQGTPSMFPAAALAMELLEGFHVTGRCDQSRSSRCATAMPSCRRRWSGSPENTLRLQFDPLTVAEEEMLTMVLFPRADSWMGWGESREWISRCAAWARSSASRFADWDGVLVDEATPQWAAEQAQERRSCRRRA